MGKQIHLEKVRSLFEKSPVVGFKSIERIIKSSPKGSYPRLMVHNLIKNGEIYKIGKGMYTKYPESTLAVFSFKPSYLGLQSSLSHHRLWEQETIPIIITTKKPRRGVRKFLGSNVMVKNIGKQYFFGFTFFKEGDFYLPYSDIEKTFIDMVVFNQRMDKETIRAIINKINKNRLNIYLKKYPQVIHDRVKKVLQIT